MAAGPDPARAQPGQMQSWPLGTAAPDRHPRPGARARRRRLVHRAVQRPSRLVRPQGRPHRADRTGLGLVAAWRDPGTGQGRLDHRRRTERHRAGRLARPQGAGLSAAAGHALRQPQHRRLRRRRRPVVHRPVRLCRQAGGEDRAGQRAGKRRAAADPTASAPRRPARSGGARWPARSSPASTGAPATRSWSSRPRATRARAASGATAGAASGSANGTAANVSVHDPQAGTWKPVEAAGQQPQGLCGVRRRARHGLGERLGGNAVFSLRSAQPRSSSATPSRATAPTCARSWAGPARCGCPKAAPSTSR